jgi:hypothetical protein
LIASWICRQRAAPLLTVLTCVLVLAAIVPGYPLGPAVLAAALLLAGALQWRLPRLWLVLVPAALPVLDLAPLTGRFFVDEFDALLAVTVLVHSARALAAAPVRPDPAAPAMTPAARIWLTLFGLSTCAALVLAAWPFPAPGLNGWNHYYSPYNGLRLAKGFGWALLLWPMLRAALAADVVKTQRRFAFGMGLGVAAATLAVLWERAAFTGLLDFTSSYRVVGLFSGMHVGGAYIEAYFAIALPFLAWWTLASRRWHTRLAGAGALGLGCYALLVTYARAGYLAAALALLVLVLAPQLRARAPAPTRLLRAAALLALLGACGWGIANGDAMQRRYALTARDLAIRLAHWGDAARMVDPSAAALLAGMGIGRYPATYFMRSGEGIHPALHLLQRERVDGADHTWLTIAAGTPLYVEQFVSIAPAWPYQLRLRARSHDRAARLDAPLCQKWLLYSTNCVWLSIAVGDTGGAWREFLVHFTSAPRWSPRHALRPLKLSLFGASAGSVIDVDDVSLRDLQGRELLRNGSFEAGTDHWFFTSDNHLPWHLENTWLQLAFEQGLAGLLTFGALLLCALAALRRRLHGGDRYAPVLAAALTAFLVLSIVNSVFDFPRISLLVYLLLFHALSDDRKKIRQGIL